MQMKPQCLFLRTAVFFFLMILLHPGHAQNIERATKATPAYLNAFVKKAKVFSLNPSFTRQLVQQKQAHIETSIVFDGKTYVLQLTQYHPFSHGFFVMDENGRRVDYSMDHAVRYKGKIKGDPQSLVALNVYNNSVNAIIADKEGNINIGEMDNGDMIMYRESDLLQRNAFDCEAIPVPGTESNPLPALFQNELLGDVVNVEAVDIYFEADYSCYTGKGSNITNTINWVLDLASNCSILFENDSVNVKLSALKVWTVSDPYAATSNTSQALSAFSSAMVNGFPGDLAHLLSRRGLGGGRAYLNALCYNSSYKTGVSGNLGNSIVPLPSYSWNSMVITHELGHNIASNHTQWCGWPGGAIDNCYTTEGGCAQGPAPTNGGTIMSYCHLTSYGINLANGFGPLPGAAIRNAVRNNNCIYPKINFSKTSETIPEENADIENDCMDYKLVTLKMACNYLPSQPVQIELLPTAQSGSLQIGFQKDVELVSPAQFTLNDTLAQTIQLKVYDDAIIEPTESLRLDYTIVNSSSTNAKKGSLYYLYIQSADHRPDSTGNQMLFYEDFESASLPGTWTTQIIYGNASPNRWHIGNSADTLFPNKAAYVSNNAAALAYSGSSSTDSCIIRLESPIINAGDFSNLRMTYASKCLGEFADTGGSQGGAAMDYGAVYYSTNGGSSWSILLNNIAGRNFRSISELSFPAAANNKPNLKIAFEWRNNSSTVNNPPFIIDSIVITGSGPGPIQSLEHIANSDTAYLGPNATVHFYNQQTGNVMASIKNLSAFDFGCTQVDLIRTGTQAKFAWNTNAADMLTDKVYKITTTNNDGIAPYELSLYTTADEVAGWATATGNPATALSIIQSIEDPRTLSPHNAPIYGSSNSNALFAANGDRIIKAVFKNHSWFALGKAGITPQCAGNIQSFESNVGGNSYQWQVDTGSGFVNISNNSIYSGSNTAILNLLNAPTNWYGYLYRCVVQTNEGTQYSNIKTLKFVAYWKGAVSNAWEQPANWECGKVPDAHTDVWIPNTAAQNPVLSSNTSIRTLTIMSGAGMQTIGTAQLLVLE